MAQPMTPDEMASMQAKAKGGGGAPAGDAPGADDAEEQEGGDVTSLVQDVGQGLAQLSQMLDKSQGVTDQDRQQMAQIMSLFSDLVEKKLGGSAPGEDQPPEEMPADQGAVSAQGGMKGVPMGPQSRQ